MYIKPTKPRHHPMQTPATQCIMDDGSFLSRREDLKQRLALFRRHGIFQHLMSTINYIILDTLFVKYSIAKS